MDVVAFLLIAVVVVGLITLIFFLVSDVLLGKEPDEPEVVSKAVSKTEQIETFVNQLPPNEVAKQQLITEMHLRKHLERLDGNVKFIAGAVFMLFLLSLSISIFTAIIYLREIL